MEARNSKAGISGGLGSKITGDHSLETSRRQNAGAATICRKRSGGVTFNLTFSYLENFVLEVLSGQHDTFQS